MRKLPGPPTASVPNRQLFDAESAWRTDPMTPFVGYICSKQFIADAEVQRNSRVQNETLRTQSVAIYSVMFRKFLKFLATARGLRTEGQPQPTVLDAAPADIHRFLHESFVRPTHATTWRYVRLLERVYAHLAREQLVSANPVTDWVLAQLEEGGRERLKVGNESAPPAVVSQAAVSQLFDWLHKHGSAALQVCDWRRFRDFALCSLSLGTGMRLTELIKLQTKQIRHRPYASREERLDVHIEALNTVDTGTEHSTRAHPECIDLVELWLGCRRDGFPMAPTTRKSIRPALHIPGNLIFPANAKGAQLEPSTVYKKLKDIADLAVRQRALTPETRWVLGRGVTGMRRAFVLSELEAGQPDDVLGFRLGLHHAESVSRYREQVEQVTGIRPAPLDRRKPSSDAERRQLTLPDHEVVPQQSEGAAPRRRRARDA